MLVFIDESGDPGFKVVKGSTPVFAVAMAIFNDAQCAQNAESVIEQCRHDCGITKEFRFNKCSDEIRDNFFQAVRSCDFSVRAIVVQKHRIYSERLRTVKEDFYRYFIKQVMKFDNGTLSGSRVIIDGSGDREFKRDLKTHLKRHTAQGAIKEVKFQNSENDSLVQLADMCAGAIARSYRSDRSRPDRWRRMLRPRIDDIWDFG